MLGQGAPVGGNHIRGNGTLAVQQQKFVGIQIIKGGLQARLGIKAAGLGHTALHEKALFLFIGNGFARPHTHPDLAFVAHGRQIGGLHLHHGHLAIGQANFAHSHRGQRQDVAIGTQGSQVLQQLVTDVQAAGLASVIRTDDEVARLRVARQVIGKGTDGLGKFVGVAGGDGALNAIRLHIGQQRLYELGGQHGVSRVKRHIRPAGAHAASRHFRLLGHKTGG